MAELIRIYEENPRQREIRNVVQVLRDGGLVIFPSDTVYAVGCDLNNRSALERLAKLKGVALEKAPFSLICKDLSHLSQFTKQIDTPTFKLLKRALPGPYTFILLANNSMPKVFKKRKEVGIRVPDHGIVSALLDELGNPMVATSIHDEDEILEYTTDPELIYEKWEHFVDIVIDGGYGGNIASTVINLCKPEPEVIREGKGTLDILQ